MEVDWPVFDMKVKTLLAVIEAGSYTKAAEAESDPAGGESSDSFAGK